MRAIPRSNAVLRRLTAAVAGVSALALVSVVPAQADDNGDALLTIYQNLPASIEYGQNLTFSGDAQDLSLSCLGPVSDCDTPEGYVYIKVDGGQYLATSDLNPYDAGNGDISFWGPMVYDGRRLLPGTYVLYFGMESTFRPTGYSWTLTVRRIACTVSLTQSTPSSNPNDGVTFTASIAGNGDHSGQMVFTDQNGLVLANPVIVNGQAAFTTAGLPQGTTTVTASWSVNSVAYDPCSASVSHSVASDPNPTAFDDTVHVDAGATVTVHPLDNDYDRGPGPLRAEYLDSPDFGDAESLDSNGTALQYTAPSGVVTVDQMHYIAYDGIGQGSNEATITFVVGCQPEADDDSYDVTYGTPLSVPAPGVYANDDRCDLPTDVVTQPAHGAVTFDGDGGGFTYIPGPGYSGTDSFTYRYSQGLETTVDATVYLSVGQPIVPTSSTSSTTTTTSPPESTTSTSSTTSGPPVSETSTTTLPGTTSTGPVLGPPTITSVDPAQGRAGDVVTVSGANFVPGQTTIHLGPASTSGGIVAQAIGEAVAVTDHLTFVVPQNVPPGVVQLTVSTPFGTSTTGVAFTVLPSVAAPSSTGDPAAPGVTLPVTGSGGRPAILAGALLAGGLAIVGVSRRGRRTAR